MNAGPIVTAEFYLDRITDEAARDAIRQACAGADRGPVPIVNKAGTRIGAIVAPETIARHASHGPEVTCRPAGNGLCEPLDGVPSPGPGVGC